MSISQLLQPNNYNLFGKSLNGITTEDITGTNENGQVLTIVDKLEKKVAFVDAPSGIPDTVGFPDGYVLKIVDNTQNQVSWEPDIGGGAAVPFILTGDSVNALKVQTSTFEPMIRVDTVDREVHLSGIRNVVEGSDDEKKFSVVNSADPLLPVFNVDTLNTKIEVNNGLTKNAEIVLLNTPETLIPAVNSAVNMKLQYDAGGGGDTNFVGYVAKNGPSAMFNLVNKDTAGIFFLSDASAAIQTTAQELNISSTNPLGKLTAIFNQEISLEANGCELNVGNNGVIETSSKFIIDGDNDAEKFLVKDGAGNNVLWVDTVNDSVYISGNNTSGSKLGVQNALGDFIFVVDTNNDSLTMGNGSVNPSQINLKPTNGFIEIIGASGGVFKTFFRCNHIINSTGGSVEMSAYRDNTDYNKIESNGALGLLIRADTELRLESTAGALMSAATGATIVCENGFVNILAIEPIGGITTNLRLQNDGKLLLTEDLGPPQNQLEFTYNSIVSKGSPVSNTATINFQPNSNTISMSDTSMNIISINNQPTLAQHGTRKDYVDNKVGGLSSGITNSPTAVGTVIGTNQPLNPTSFLPSEPTTPANYFKAGQSFTLTMSGNCQFFNGDTFDIKLIATDSLANVVNLGTINIQTPNTAASVFELEADFTVRSVIGTTSNLVCSFDFTYNDAGSIVGKRSFTSASIRVDLVETLTTAINYSSANAASTITTALFILKKVVDV